MANNKSKGAPSNKPVAKFQYRGVVASVFENEAENGSLFYKVSIARTYRDGEQFKSTSSFSRDDLPLVAQVANEAWLSLLEYEASASHKDS